MTRLNAFEQAILLNITAGKSAAEISAALGVPRGQVLDHTKVVLKKLSVPDTKRTPSPQVRTSQKKLNRPANGRL
jgi:DNA-binding NarL/FixJ family response regulator